MADLAKILGENIKKARQAAKLTQEVLAEAISLDSRSISRIERGNALPSLSTLEAISITLNVGLGELFEGMTKSKSEIAQEIESLLATLPAQKQQGLLELVRSMVRIAK
ncbi:MULTISPECIES: helix-turn-helix domain-containing protein [Deefgea]|uniref:Helix-turn-helix domain-containing protein n=2 Tax=Deefgea TaxID=400947 RepID=A0ABX8Z6M4_9NEIS|nr:MULTISPECIES: helix-turn-helix transcriptional regulator [Deefgea]MBM5572322.1 helix-turn-helix domain-containing protein [Deefgea chitinilytica]MBM9889558.1 helix-turn-helix transcriptional regulator [Deefgea sp. CFH1-16]QZA78206.1 helix-turn-helix domain-containing protein [Deefgea tanakiae]